MTKDNKGFTLVEVLAAITIIAIILLIAVPVYNGVNEQIKNNLYDSKINNIKSKAIEYASETNYMIFDVRTLISEGKITPDNILENYLDPRNNRDMSCDILNVNFINGIYEATIIESNICYSEEELNNLYGAIELNVYDENNNQIDLSKDNLWTNKNPLIIKYNFKEQYKDLEQYIKEVTWTGDIPLVCNENIAECNSYKIMANDIKNVMVTIQIKVTINEQELFFKQSKQVAIDLQKPQVVKDSIKYDQNTYSNFKKKLEFELTDNHGSGINSFAVVTKPVCEGEEFENNLQLASSGIQTEYLNNGTYYICVVDNVGNKNVDENMIIQIENVDIDGPDIVIKENNTWGKTNKIVFDITDDVEVESYSFSDTSEKPSEFYPVNKQSITVSKEYNENGTYYIWALDVSGNMSKQEFEVKFVDNQNPTAVIKTPDVDAGTNVPTSFTLEDGESGLKRYAVLNSENENPNWKNISGSLHKYSFNQIFNKNGTYYIWIEDMAGNIAKVSFVIKNVDITAPTFKVEQSKTWVKSDTVKVTITDNESGVAYYKWTDTNTAPTSWYKASSTPKSLVISKVFTANKVMYLWAKDALGNVSNVKVAENFIDRSRPKIKYERPTNWVNTNRTIKLEATDVGSGVAGIYYKTSSDGTYKKYTGPITVDSRLVYAYAEDRAGNKSTFYAYTNVDRIAPYTPCLDIEQTSQESMNRSVSCTKNDYLSTTDNNCTIVAKNRDVHYWFFADDNDSGVAKLQRETYVNGRLVNEITVNEGDLLPYFTYSGKTHVAKIYAIDEAGNRSTGALVLTLKFS